MSTAFSVTELAVAARCARQMLFAREGFRVSSGGAGIGQAAHAVLAAFVEHGARHPALERALEQDPADEDRLLQGVVEAVYREYFDRAGALAAGCTAAEVVGLGRIVFQLAPLLRELLLRARRSGLSGADAFARTLEASERRVSLELDGGRVLVHGAIDLLCRDLQRNKGYVVDLKTGLTDVAAEEQVRLYALALARSGERFQPALAYASRDALEIKSVEPFDEDAERALDGRVRARSAAGGRPGDVPELSRAETVLVAVGPHAARRRAAVRAGHRRSRRGGDPPGALAPGPPRPARSNRSGAGRDRAERGPVPHRAARG